VAEYEDRFDELMNAGLPWINMSCYGVHDGILIIGIESARPQNAQRGPVGRTSVNYAGPPVAVVQHGWDANEALTIEG
jgi:hypothetical protein